MLSSILLSAFTKTLLVLKPVLEFLNIKILDPTFLDYLKEKTVLPFYDYISSNYKLPLKVSVE